MKQDLVKFIIPYDLTKEVSCGGRVVSSDVEKKIADTLNMTVDEVNSVSGSRRVIASPLQFARFIVLFNGLLKSQNFRNTKWMLIEMSPEIVRIEPKEPALDVSQR